MERPHGEFGSFSKWFLGSGFEVLTRTLTKQAIEKLSDSLGLPMERASVYRIDFGSNFVMSKPVRSYTSQLEPSGRFRMDTFNNLQSVYYRKTDRELIFYDKLAEIRKKKAEIPLIPLSLVNKHVLRYEVRFLRRAAYYMNQPKIFATRLWDASFFELINRSWLDQYLSINKNREPRPGICPKGWRDLKDSLSAHGVCHIGGKQVVLDEIERMKQDGTLNKVTASRLKTNLNLLLNMGTITKGTNEMIELDNKVQQTYENNRE